MERKKNVLTIMSSKGGDWKNNDNCKPCSGIVNCF